MYMNVGITELRANLASIIDAAANGETVVVTERGQPRVTISAVASSPDETMVERAIREGWATVGPGYYHKRADRTPRVTMRSRPGVTLADIFAEDRGDR